MTVYDTPSPVTPSTRPSLSSRWSEWAGYAAAAWSLVYGMLGLFWTFGGAGFPFGVGHDEQAREVSLLEKATPHTVGPVIAVLGIAAAGLALVTIRRRRRELSPFPSVVAATLAVGLAVVIPDYRPLLAVVRLPILTVGAPFDWPEQVGLSDFLSLFMPWPVANQILLMVGGLLWWATAVTWWRRSRSACLNCGRRASTHDAATVESAVRWGRRAVLVAVAIPLLYAATRWAWVMNIPLGLSREGIRIGAREMPGVWIGGALLATMGAMGALLTLGLIQRWGEVYPGWIPRLRGKPVRPRTAIIPASVVSILIGSAGLMFVRAAILGSIEIDSETWGLTVPQLFWPLWSVALAGATFAYNLRRRGPCDRHQVPNPDAD